MGKIYNVQFHGKQMKIYAINPCCAVIVGGRMFMYPYLYGKNRHSNDQRDKESEAVFDSLDWNFISECSERTGENTLIVSCEGHTFELAKCDDMP